MAMRIHTPRLSFKTQGGVEIVPPPRARLAYLAPDCPRLMATIKDVARLARVGLGTASRVVSGKGSVAPATARRVHKAIQDRKSTRLNSSHDQISYAVFCLKKKKNSSDLTCTKFRG